MKKGVLAILGLVVCAFALKVFFGANYQTGWAYAGSLLLASLAVMVGTGMMIPWLMRQQL